MGYVSGCEPNPTSLTRMTASPPTLDNKDGASDVAGGAGATDLQLIDVALSACLAPSADKPERLLEAMRFALLGPGKRLRPRLVLAATEACGGEREPALGAACAVECIHAYSLVHDDLPAMDDDDLRRGRPTCHRRFDEATAILVGDALQGLAFERLVHGAPAPEIAARCCAELSTAVGAEGLVGGQADDLAGEEGLASSELDPLEHLKRIHRRKTGALITVSLRLGAIVAKASDEQLQSLTTYGEKLGLAFQVTDDLLDAQGDADEVGKRTGKDAQQGKLTYPGLMGVEESRVYAGSLVQEAIAALAPFGTKAEPLRAVAQKILNRDR